MLKQLGCSPYELGPRGQAAPYHLHHGNEELLGLPRSAYRPERHHAESTPAT